MSQDKEKLREQDLKHSFVICAYGESPFLEDCIQSLLSQKHPSQCAVATSTPSDFLSAICEKHHLPLYVNENGGGLSKDWNFALSCAQTPLVTIAHQDDLYLPDYSLNIIKAAKQGCNPLILYTDYHELIGDRRVRTSLNLKIKRIANLQLRLKALRGTRFFKRLGLRFCASIPCPAVCFYLPNTGTAPFESDFSFVADWDCWETLSRRVGEFVFVPQMGMIHRLHENSQTQLATSSELRNREEQLIFDQFWPKPVAKILARLYSLSQKTRK